MKQKKKEYHLDLLSIILYSCVVIKKPRYDGCTDYIPESPPIDYKPIKK